MVIHSSGWEFATSGQNLLSSGAGVARIELYRLLAGQAGVSAGCAPEGGPAYGGIRHVRLEQARSWFTGAVH